jgi:hypothetical protein
MLRIVLEGELWGLTMIEVVWDDNSILLES